MNNSLLENVTDGNIEINDDIYSHLYNGVEIKNKTFLMWVSAKGYTNDVKSLIDNGADVNARNNFGWTPLMCGCYYGHTEVVRLLLENGADVNARNNDGQTALELAEKFNVYDIWNDIIILLKQCAIEQIIPELRKRQKNQIKLGWLLREKKVKNRGGRLPYDLEHYIRGFIG